MKPDLVASTSTTPSTPSSRKLPPVSLVADAPASAPRTIAMRTFDSAGDPGPASRARPARTNPVEVGGGVGVGVGAGGGEPGDVGTLLDEHATTAITAANVASDVQIRLIRAPIVQ